MRVHLCKTLWGVHEFHSFNFQLWKDTVQLYKSQGFNGLEIATQFFSHDKSHINDMIQLCKENELKIITQIHSCGYPINSINVDDHLSDIRQKVEQSVEIWKADHINCHSGKDSFSLQKNIEFYQKMIELQQSVQTTICHETHRQRSFFNPFIFRDTFNSLKQNKQLLNINMDLSHWIIVCERLLNVDSPQDQEWQEILDILLQNTKQIHARIGSSQQIQLINPFDGQNQSELDYYSQIYKRIIQKQTEMGTEDFFITCEFGPTPYQILDHTGSQYYDLQKVNLQMQKYLRKHVI